MGRFDQIDEREQYRQPTENQASRNQPGRKIAPLDLVCAVVGDITEHGAKEQWNRASKQRRVQRIRYVAGDALCRVVSAMGDNGHEGFLIAGRPG